MEVYTETRKLRSCLFGIALDYILRKITSGYRLPSRVVYYNWQFGIKVGKVVYYLLPAKVPVLGSEKSLNLKILIKSLVVETRRRK